MALRGHIGAIEGRNGRILAENQYKIGHSLTDTAFVFVRVVCTGGWRRTRIHKETAFFRQVPLHSGLVRATHLDLTSCIAANRSTAQIAGVHLRNASTQTRTR